MHLLSPLSFSPINVISEPLGNTLYTWDFCQRMLSSVCSQLRFKRAWYTPHWVLNLSCSVLLQTAWCGNSLVLNKVSSIFWIARLAVLREVVWLQVWKSWVELWGAGEGCLISVWCSVRKQFAQRSYFEGIERDLGLWTDCWLSLYYNSLPFTELWLPKPVL